MPPILYLTKNKSFEYGTFISCTEVASGFVNFVFLSLITITLVFFALCLVHLKPKQRIKRICCLNLHCFKMAENVLRKLMTLLSVDQLWKYRQGLLHTPPSRFVLCGSLEELKCFGRVSICSPEEGFHLLFNFTLFSTLYQTPFYFFLFFSLVSHFLPLGWICVSKL